MAFYRAYNVDSIGKTLGFVSFEAADDADACEQAETFRTTHSWTVTDVWEIHRKLECPRKITATAPKVLMTGRPAQPAP
jgi:hypothetical protein